MAIRVTQNMLNNNMLRNLNNSMGNMDKLQEMLSSGKKVSKPSDDPVVVVRGMFYRSSLMENEQFTKNTTEALSWLDTTDQALDEVGNVLKRVQELLVQSGNGSMSKDDLKMMAMEIKEIKNHVGHISNQTVNGRHIFAGSDTQNPPYDVAAGKFTNTNSTPVRLEVSEGTFVPVNINAQNVFNNPAANNVFDLLDKVIVELQNGKSAAVYSNDVSQQMDNVLTERSTLGARVNRLELVEDRLSKSEVSITGLMSKNEDADAAEVMTDLKAQENVHRAALSSGARIIQPTLIDFLR
ncbi:flagellar hook-associated protein FlgL [Brevibacillus fortis]|uniref:flagellar hook-associated protein FlgL n=1 Tax=Brevibacillus fortis TaxID=2126352 RepID=UPI002E1A3DB6|nr:flagellar hook-associated protein FlgL [Brevibacillus fortis]